MRMKVGYWWPENRETSVSRSPLLALVVAISATASILVAGCSTQDKICGGGEYPVKAVGSTTGSECVPNGKEPPAGYVRYPAGEVPKYVDDKWDKYWSTVVVDSSGKVVKN